MIEALKTWWRRRKDPLWRVIRLEGYRGHEALKQYEIRKFLMDNVR